MRCRHQDDAVFSRSNAALPQWRRMRRQRNVKLISLAGFANERGQVGHGVGEECAALGGGAAQGLGTRCVAIRHFSPFRVRFRHEL